MRLVTFLTDFGDSAYVGAMKGVIASICPEARIVDITHGIREFDVRQAAYELYAAAAFFPKGTVHCAVVDPTVGAARRGVIVETKDYFFVGPDNGIFTFIEGIKCVYELKSDATSYTFHGRDVFAPAAARLACGKKPSALGKKVSGIKRIPMRKVLAKDGRVSGEVISIDRFGNIITNIRGEDVEEAGIGYGKTITITLKDRSRKAEMVKSYGFARKGGLVCVIGSAGYMEVAINQGDASAALRVSGGEEVRLG